MSGTLPLGYAGAPVFFMAALAIAVSIPVSGMSADILRLTADDNGRDVTVHRGDVIEVRLPENATTGYRWAVDAYDKTVLTLVDEGADYPEAALGSGGQAIFRFRVVAEGRCALSFKYWRHWEGPASIQRRFSARIVSG